MMVNADNICQRRSPAFVNKATLQLQKPNQGTIKMSSFLFVACFCHSQPDIISSTSSLMYSINIK